VHDTGCSKKKGIVGFGEIIFGNNEYVQEIIKSKEFLT